MPLQQTSTRFLNRVFFVLRMDTARRGDGEGGDERVGGG